MLFVISYGQYTDGLGPQLKIKTMATKNVSVEKSHNVVDEMLQLLCCNVTRLKLQSCEIKIKILED